MCFYFILFFPVIISLQKELLIKLIRTENLFLKLVRLSATCPLSQALGYPVRWSKGRGGNLPPFFQGTLPYPALLTVCTHPTAGSYQSTPSSVTDVSKVRYR